MLEAKKFLDNYFLSKVGKKNIKLLRKQNLIDSGIIDSLDIVTLSVMIKKKFGVDISINSQKSINLFKSYDSILNVIKKNEKQKNF